MTVAPRETKSSLSPLRFPVSACLVETGHKARSKDDT